MAGIGIVTFITDADSKRMTASGCVVFVVLSVLVVGAHRVVTER